MGGFVAVNAWNPVGWGTAAGLSAGAAVTGATVTLSGFAATSAGMSTAAIFSISAIAALSALGVVAMVIYSEYELGAAVGAEGRFDDEGKPIPKGSFSIKLKPGAKRK